MTIKANERQLSFLFSDSDSFLDMGCGILAQELLSQVLPFQRKQHNGKEKLIFRTDRENIVKLDNVIERLDEHALTDLLYEIFFLNRKIEENGFLRRECIWYHYDNIYYDIQKNSIRVAVLPVIGQPADTELSDWTESLYETLEKIIDRMPQQRAEKVTTYIVQFRAGKLSDDEMLERLDHLGCGVSGLLSGQLAQHRDITLELLYIGKGNRLEFIVGNKDFIIGRDRKADGVIPHGFSGAVSRRHCLIARMQNKYFVQDLKSVNHTLVNGIMIPPYELMEIGDNDILSVADIEFRVKKQETGSKGGERHVCQSL